MRLTTERPAPLPQIKTGEPITISATSAAAGGNLPVAPVWTTIRPHAHPTSRPLAIITTTTTTHASALPTTTTLAATTSTPTERD